jgi:hypothetical protein
MYYDSLAGRSRKRKGGFGEPLVLRVRRAFLLRCFEPALGAFPSGASLEARL